MNTEKSKIWLFIMFCLFFLISRSIFLDRDLPSWQLAQYQPIDELYYSIGSFNLFQYNTLHPQIIEGIKSDSQPANIIGQILCFISLSIFGNNYYGLRFSAVFASLLVFMFISLSINNLLLKSHGGHKYISFYWIFLVLMLFNFPFILSGRVFEPTVFRMLAIAVILYLCSSSFLEHLILDNAYTVLLGYISMFFVCFFYPTNIFIVPSMLVVSMFLNNENATTLYAVLFRFACFAFGSIICLLCYEIFLRYYFNSSLFSLSQDYMIYSSRVNFDANIFHYFQQGFKNLIGIFQTNFFRLDPLLVLAFFFLLPFLLLDTDKKNISFRLPALSLSVFYAMQSFFINDYIFRKGISIFPLFIVIMYFSAEAYISHLNKSSAIMSPNPKFTLIRSIFLLLGFVIVYLNFKYLPVSEKNIVLGFFLVQAAGVVLACNTTQKCSSVAFVLIVSLFSPSFALSVKHIYYKPKYSYKNAMIDIGNILDSQVVIGGVGYGFRLYNSSKPIMNIYAYQYTDKGRHLYSSMLENILRQNAGRYTILYRPHNDDSFIASNSFLCREILPINIDLIDSKNKASIAIYEYVKQSWPGDAGQKNRRDK